MHSRHDGPRATLRRLLSAGVSACVIAGVMAGSTHAQVAPPIRIGNNDVPPGTKLLLSANKVVYDNGAHIVVARGAVRIAYGGYRLVAKRVEYDQDSGRVKASGEVALISPDGNKLYADDLDVTDDFSDGFVNALRIDTTQRTHIVAESAERRGGVETQFNKGVYTACEPCKKHPEKAPFWQIKARRVVNDTKTQTIRMRDATFDLFGLPVAYFPYFSVPTQKRKSGFLRPGIEFKEKLGVGVTVPYYWVISPYMDATLTGTVFSKQGFLAQGEFRQRFRNGFHTLTLAGIDQAKPEAFDDSAVETVDEGVSTRGMIASQAQFEINPRWKVGWNLFFESDADFARTYGISGYNGSEHTSDAHLTGLSGRNYFDLHGYYFDEQPDDDQSASDFDTLEDRQPLVLPVIDYSYIFDQPIFGGQLSFTANETSLSRDATEVDAANQLKEPDGTARDPIFGRYSGLEGNDSRLSGELEWKKTYTTSNGFLLTPILAARGDAFYVNVDDLDDPVLFSGGDDFAGNGTHTRTMETAGLEVRYPILASSAHSTNVIEPIAQVFVRPNETLTGGLPNEDAQAFVFDTTNLFRRDKFSGFDRVEGGTRANLGIRYTGSFDNGITLQSVVGQSYQLAGENSFAAPDLVYAGHDSGLEDDISDYVGSFGVTLPVGVNLNTEARFDNTSLSLQRTDVTAGYTGKRVTTNIVYSQLAPQPEYGSTDTLREVTTSGSLKFAKNWSVSGTATYDIENNGFSRDGIGLGYNNECFTFNIGFSQTRDLMNDPTGNGDNYSIGATLSFRTLGDVSLGSNTLSQPTL